MNHRPLGSSPPDTSPLSTSLQDSIAETFPNHAVTTTATISSLSKEYSSHVHTTTAAILTSLQSFPSLLSATTPFLPSPSLQSPSLQPSSAHSFTNRARTATTASGKPIFTTLAYNLTLTTTATGLSFVSSSDATGGNSTGSQSHSHDATATVADVHGHIILEPEPFDTTRVTMSATVLLGDSVTKKSPGRQSPKGIAKSATWVSPTYSPSTLASRLAQKASFANLSTATPLAHATLDHLLSCVPNLHAMYARYDEIDDAIYAEFVLAIPSAPPVRAHETALCDKSRAYDDQVRNGDVRRARARTQGKHTKHTHTY